MMASRKRSSWPGLTIRGRCTLDQGASRTHRASRAVFTSASGARGTAGVLAGSLGPSPCPLPAGEGESMTSMRAPQEVQQGYVDRSAVVLHGSRNGTRMEQTVRRRREWNAVHGNRLSC
jgi:hypothetical protein